MRAAEQLFAKHGIDQVSVRGIIREAGQKNESALQYHFGNRAGLILALQRDRNEQVTEKRRSLLASMTGSGREPSIREICELIIVPPMQCCRSDPGFRDFVGVFGQMLLATSESLSDDMLKRDFGDSRMMVKLVRAKLTHLDERVADLRLENIVRFATLSISSRARGKGSFRGKSAGLFQADLIDTMVAMLSAPSTDQTLSLLDD